MAGDNQEQASDILRRRYGPTEEGLEEARKSISLPEDLTMSDFETVMVRDGHYRKEAPAVTPENMLVLVEQYNDLASFVRNLAEPV